MNTPVLKSRSPLDSLVRQASTPRAHPSRSEHARTQLPPSLAPPLEIPIVLALQYHDRLSPASPLLHGHFARDSVATASSSGDNSYVNSTRTSIDSRITGLELNHRYYDVESVYSENIRPGRPDSWQSAAREGKDYQDSDATPNPNFISYSQERPSTSNASAPTLIVSSPSDLIETTEYTRAGRMPIMGPTGSNFSRPVRPVLSSTPEDEQQKRRVLERNARRAPSPSAINSISNPEQRTKSPIPAVRSTYSDMRSPSPDDRQVVSSSELPSRKAPFVMPIASLSSGMHHQPTTTPLSLPNGPPSMRTGSSVSLYSGYSFYQLDSASSSPTREVFHDRVQAPSPPGESSAAQLSPITDLNLILDNNTPTPQDYLQQGIQHHEANRLKESAICFEKSAKENGGCGIGMLMWGLALRHGWGCEKNEKFAFKWLTRAAESAVEDLENARAGRSIDSNAVQVCDACPLMFIAFYRDRSQTELVLAIYEVGQCFFQGWGVAKDQKMAVVRMGSSTLLSG